jgi:hypothetical protein
MALPSRIDSQGTRSLAALQGTTGRMRAAANAMNTSSNPAATVDFSAALAERDNAIGSLSVALGSRPPRLMVARLEEVLGDDNATVATLRDHLDQVRGELARLGTGRAAARAYAATQAGSTPSRLHR